MAFGQQSGPPASAKQLSYLLSLVQGAGFEGFRDARHPLGLTQRQAGGKFTGGEASELIDRLLAGEVGDPGDLDGAEQPDGGSEPAGRSVRSRGGRGADGGSPRTWGARPNERPTGLRSDAAAARAQQRLDDERGELLAGMPADDLVAELERRGWTVTPPDDLR
jgi:hypothetical protein